MYIFAQNKTNTMKANIRLNDTQAMLILEALEVKIKILTDYTDVNGYVCNSDKSELRKLENLANTIDSTFWTKNGILKDEAYGKN